eukprot:gene19413-biopygen14562
MRLADHSQIVTAQTNIRRRRGGVHLPRRRDGSDAQLMVGVGLLRGGGVLDHPLRGCVLQRLTAPPPKQVEQYRPRIAGSAIAVRPSGSTTKQLSMVKVPHHIKRPPQPRITARSAGSWSTAAGRGGGVGTFGKLRAGLDVALREQDVALRE